MNRIKKLIAVALSAATVASVSVIGGTFTAGASGTGAGLAEYALNAYYEGWSYVWGGSSPGAVDCSGLIWSYCGGDRMDMLCDAQNNGRDWGYVSDGVPRVHGLGLSRPGHVGVYIEDGMEVDARGDEYDMCYQAIGDGGWNNWDCWFKLTAVTYPTTGWETFNGNSYYYENGEYIVNTSRTIDGVTYYFDAKGHSSSSPSGSSSGSSGSDSSNTGGSARQGNDSQASTSSNPTSWSKGSSGDEVIKIQTRLAELGYYTGAIDGDFGEATDAAFRAFQAAAGLTVDGIAGSDREVLYSDNAPKAKAETEETKPAEPEETKPAEETTEPTEPENIIWAQNGDFSDLVATVQGKLAELGYFGLEPTGLYGEYTAEAVMNFQLANGLEATGIVDTQTYEMLFSEDAVASELPAVEEEEVLVQDEAAEAQKADDIAQTEPAQAEETNTAQLPATGSDFAATASQSVAKANEVTEKALEKSSGIVPNAKTADVKRTANIWLWLVIVAAILGIAAFVLLKRSKKQTRYQRYVAKKKKMSAKAQLNTRW